MKLNKNPQKCIKKCKKKCINTNINLKSININGKYQEIKDLLTINKKGTTTLIKNEDKSFFNVKRIEKSDFFTLVRDNNLFINPNNGEVEKTGKIQTPDLAVLYIKNGKIMAKSVGTDKDNGNHEYYNFKIDNNHNVISMETIYCESGIIGNRDVDEQWPVITKGILKKVSK